jgi:hypothetical protein
MKIFSPSEKLLALSWKQPYAELMLKGKIETRTWNTNYRGWVLICASKQPYFTEQLRRISGGKQLVRMGDFLAKINPGFEGKAIAIGRLVDCRPMRKEDEDKCFVQFFPDLFCHVYEDVQAIEPIPWKGKQGWSEVSPEVKAKIILL